MREEKTVGLRIAFMLIALSALILVGGFPGRFEMAAIFNAAIMICQSLIFRVLASHVSESKDRELIWYAHKVPFNLACCSFALMVTHHFSSPMAFSVIGAIVVALSAFAIARNYCRFIGATT